MSDYVTSGPTFRRDSVIKPQMKEICNEESYDFEAWKLIGGPKDVKGGAEE